MESSLGETKYNTENLSALSSARSVTNVPFDESTLTDVMFPLTKPFMKLDIKEKESLFMKMYEETILFIRNKELKCDNTPVIHVYEDDAITHIQETREQNYESSKESECKQQLTQRQSKALSTLPPRVENNFSPTFDPLLNTNYTSKFTKIDEFKACISKILIENRAKKRIQQINKYLKESKTKPISALSSTLTKPVSTFSKSELLNVQIEIINEPIQFIIDPPLQPLSYPEINIVAHSPEHEFLLYEPTLYEKFALTPFSRTETSAFVPFPVAQPDIFPSVREEQPIQERVPPPADEQPPVAEPTTSPSISARSSGKIKAQSSQAISFIMQTTKVVQYPRQMSLFTPAELVPQPVDLPDLDIEIGRSSILALPPAEFAPMMTSGRVTRVAPFAFVGLQGPKKLKPLSGPDPVDLREIEDDDDIDNISVSQNPKPITDFLTKPLESKNKSHILTEAVIDGQGKWKERQRESVRRITESITAMNDMIHDKSIKVTMPDLINFLQE